MPRPTRKCSTCLRNKFYCSFSGKSIICKKCSKVYIKPVEHKEDYYPPIKQPGYKDIYIPLKGEENG